ncbi:MAG: large extracellular alpha-helical protein, partial [Micavibrio aeruginosavorus]
MHRMTACTLAFLALFLTCGGSTLAAQEDGAKPLSIVRFTPSGKDTAATRQIVLEFNRPVVPLGRMERTAEETGISISPAVNCQWRWLNSTALACQIAEKDSLQEATEYKITVSPKITAEDGATLPEAQTHSFTTSLPRLVDSSMVVWEDPASPVLRLSFNQPVTKESVADHIYFQDEKAAGRISVSVAADKNDEEPPKIRGDQEARPLWTVKPAAALSANAKILLNQEGGLLSSEGTEAGIESGTIREFYTYPDFGFRGVYCFDKKNQEILLTPGTPQTDETLCNPMRPVSVSFSSPVLRSAIIDNLSITPALNGGNKDFKPWGDENRDWSRLSDDRREQAADFRTPLPVGLKAAQDYVFAVNGQKPSLWERIVAFFKGEETVQVSGLKDEFGRPVPPFEIRFATGHRNPNYELVYRDAVLEKDIDSELPVYVNNLESIGIDYRKMTAEGHENGSTGDVKVPFVQDKQFAVPAKVRDILDGRSGVLYGTLNTTPAVEDKWDGANRMFVQVTPFQLYTKLGHFQSSAWVTDLKSGKGVSDVKVTVYVGSLADPRPPQNILAEVTTDADGLATLPGLEELDPDLSRMAAWKDEDKRLFVRIDKGGDMALLPISYDYEVQLWNVATGIYSSSEQKFGHMKAWGMTAQGIYRAGDTMQYKIYLRDQDNNRFIAPPDGKYTLEITDPTGKSVDKKEAVALTEFGTLSGE